LKKALRGYWLWETVKDPETFAKAKSYVYERVKRRDFQPKIAKNFRFEDVVEAYRYMESNEQIGKIVDCRLSCISVASRPFAVPSTKPQRN
jgi:hypothetical protein